MQRTTIDYAAIGKAGNDEARRSALFAAVGAHWDAMAVGIDMLGEKAGAVYTPEQYRFGNDKALTLPSDEQVKNYLQGTRPQHVLGEKWMVPSDSASLNTAGSVVQAIFRDGLPNVDLGYTQIFDFIDMRNSTNTVFKMVNVSMGFTWEQLAEGGQIKPRRLGAEASVNVGYLTYAEGFSLLDDWIRFNEWYRVEEAVLDFTQSYFNKKADRHYALITALSAGINTAFTIDDTTTFNAAGSTLLTALETKGFGIGENPQFVILVHPSKVGRVLAMLDAKRGSAIVAFGTQKQPIAFGVGAVIVSTKVDAATNGYYLIYPGKKLKRADWLDLSMKQQRAESYAATDWFGRGQYNAVVGEPAQIRRVLFA